MIMFTTKYDDTLRLRFLPTIDYFGSDHLFGGIVGFFVFITHCIGFPIATFFYIRRLIKNNKQNLANLVKSHAYIEYFIGDTYEIQYFWFRHVNFGLLILTHTVQGYFNEATLLDFTVGGVIVIGGFILTCLLLLKLKPYIEAKKWMCPVRVYSLLLSIVATFVAIFTLVDDSGSDTSTFFFILCFGLTVGSIVLFLNLIWCFFYYIAKNVVDTSLDNKKKDFESLSCSSDFLQVNPLFGINRIKKNNELEMQEIKKTPEIV
eukprot:TRINITY_DN1265_c0_g2_i3.p1 TRINITY_DN1265_c0_g2~~TRINITY_DN1265_c0_g2_i3.p1  ORF type:complete len:262 (+),score=29.86 TRINITY_DN1265_c0_g2_i3:384-1169(+)